MVLLLVVGLLALVFEGLLQPLLLPGLVPDQADARAARSRARVQLTAANPATQSPDRAVNR